MDHHEDALEALLGEDGLIAKRLPGFERRPGQEEMMRSVLRAIDEREVLLVEAGTGTGKSLAYLVPAAISGEQITVSTATKTLQEQLFSKDIPFVRDALGLRFEAALLKGRTNYLCLHLLSEARADHDLIRHEGRWLRRLRDWASETETGDRSELEDLPERGGIWQRVSTGAEGCLGQRCKHFDECFVMLARRRAARADVIIVNHHLYFADLSLKESTGFQLLPPTDVVIFDEAHNLEDIASVFFGLSVSDYRIKDLTYGAIRACAAHGVDTRVMQARVDSVRTRTQLFFDCYRPLLPKGRLTPESAPEGLQAAYFELDNALDGLERALRDADEAHESIGHLAARCSGLRTELSVVASGADSALVTWVESGPRATFLKAAPINAGGLLQETLFSRVESLVFTSATLTTGGDFSHLKRRLGITFEVEELELPSPFDYPRQALLYVPGDLPPPRARDFVERAADRIEQLLEITDGRAFVLFTSFSNLRRVWSLLKDRLEYPLLRQGEGPKEALLRRFRDNPRSVLFGTGSFWEGVDVVGEALSMVIIDKLPFAPPDDPLTSARIEWLGQQQKNAFMDYQVPQAIIALKQGFGRLIRTRTDRGIVAILDTRLVTARYGQLFLRSLPDARRVSDLATLREAWRAQGDLFLGAAATSDDQPRMDLIAPPPGGRDDDPTRPPHTATGPDPQPV